VKNNSTDFVIIARKLLEYYQSGALKGEIMPEDENPGLPKDSEEALRYFTLPMALNYQRNSYALWKSALQTWHDPETRFVFDPAQASGCSFEILQQALLKYKVALQPNKHVSTWQKISATVASEYDGKFSNVLKQNDFDIGKILSLLATEKKKFPCLAGPKISNYWLYVLTQYTTHPFKNLSALSIAPDTHVMQASIHLGLVPANSNTLEVANAWADLLSNTDLSPIQLHTPLWLWSRQGFLPAV
jgi:hypothetical protein